MISGSYQFLTVVFLFQEIIPILNWETRTFSTPVLAVLVYASVAIFPTLILPSTPSMWVAGMTFGYGYGFLLIIGALPIGVSLPYFIGHLFHHRIQVCTSLLSQTDCTSSLCFVYLK